MRKVGKIEHSIGLELYSTDTEGIGGKIRAFWQDFRVMEMYEQHLSVRQLAMKRAVSRSQAEQMVKEKNFRFWHLAMKKRGLETSEAIGRLARLMKTSRMRFSYCGNKDKKAITTQLVSYRGDYPLPLKQYLDSQIEILGIWPMAKPVSLGSHWGNQFQITIRNPVFTTEELNGHLSALVSQIDFQKGIANFFGHQRFGIQRPVTHKIGRALLAGDMEAAVRVLVAFWTPDEGTDAIDARKRLSNKWDPKKALSYFPARLDYERIVLEHLAHHPGDFSGAFSALPKRLQILYVHGIQSYLFNRFLTVRNRLGLSLINPIEGDIVASIDARGMPMKIYTTINNKNQQKASQAIQNGKAEIVGPLVGYKTQIPQNKWGDQILKILSDEQINPDSFRLPQSPNLASQGTFRPIRMPIHQLVSNIQEDDRDPTKQMIQLSFALTKGSYATVLLREIMKTAPENYV